MHRFNRAFRLDFHRFVNWDITQSYINRWINSFILAM